MPWFSRVAATLVVGSVLAAACSSDSSGSLTDGGGPVATLGAIAGSTSGDAQIEATGEPIVVATLLDEDNILAHMDRLPGVAFIATVEQLNKAGGLLGRPIKVVRESTESRMSVVDNAARRVIAAGADLIVMTCELDFAEPAIDRAAEAGILVISPCASEAAWGTGDAGSLAFSMTAPVAEYSAQLAELLWRDNFRSVGVVWDNASPEALSECDSFSERWEELGGTVDHQVPMPNLAFVEEFTKQKDLTEPLGEVDVIFMCAFQRLGTATMSTLRDLGVLTPIFGGLTMDNATFRPVDVEGLGDYRMASFASVAGDDPAPLVASSIEAYRAVDGIPPGSGRFVLGVDLAAVWAAAVQVTGTTDGTTLADAIRRFEVIEGASGQIRFDGTNSMVNRDLRILRHSSGRMVFEQLLESPNTQPSQ
jgi:branched-chain amino acid transport system substrate-binding protein